MTDRDLNQLEELIRRVVRQELHTEWMTLEELCKLLHKSKFTIWRWEREGLIDVKTIGRAKLYKTS